MRRINVKIGKCENVEIKNALIMIFG